MFLNEFTAETIRTNPGGWGVRLRKRPCQQRLKPNVYVSKASASCMQPYKRKLIEIRWYDWLDKLLLT